MKLLIQSAMIFFGTLMAAGLVALGEPSAMPSPQARARDISGTPAVTETARWSQQETAAPRDR